MATTNYNGSADYNTGNISPNTMTTTLYANYDAYSNGQLSIFSEGGSPALSCYYPHPTACYYTHDNFRGTATTL